MSSQIGIWSQSKNVYLYECFIDDKYYIDKKTLSSYVKEADALSGEDFAKYRPEYEFIMSKFREHARTLDYKLIKTQNDYSDWVQWHISDYLLFGSKGTDAEEISLEKQQKYVADLQKYRKRLLLCTEGYIYSEDYNDINTIYGGLLVLDLELKGDGLDKMWKLIRQLMDDNKLAKKPQRIVRKTEDVIEMRNALKNLFDHYTETEKLFIKAVMTYISTRSLYKGTITNHHELVEI
jgi:hypothetical protein